MQVLKRVLRFFAEYFVFVGGLLFIFAMGFIYALIRPEGIVVNLIFLIIASGWIIFLIKHFWDLMEKSKSKGEDKMPD